MVAGKFEQTFSMPNKLKLRERIMRQNNTQGESTPAQETPSTNSFIIAKDGSLIPVHNPEILEKVNESDMHRG